MNKALYQFHVHTQYSSDCRITLEQLYKKSKALKINGIAITDHNTIKGASEFKKLYGQEIDVIIGEEIMTTKGEIIGLFLKKEIPPMLTPEETIAEIKLQNGVVYIPHPFDNNRYKTSLLQEVILKNIKNIDTIETHNGRVIDISNNLKAEEFTKSLNKVPICGSDSHSLYELGYNMIEFKCEKINRDNILQELEKAESINLKSNKKIHLYTKYVRISKLIKAGNISEVYGIILRKCKKRLFNFSRQNRKK